MENQVFEKAYYIVQIVLSIVIFWYTLETRKMRKASEKQLKIITDAQRQADRPLMSAGISVLSNSEDNYAINFFDNDQYLPVPFRNEYKKLIAQGSSIFQISLDNHAKNIALDLQAVIYDGFTKNYLFGETGVTNCSVESSQYIYTARDTYHSYDEVKSKLVGFYNKLSDLDSILKIDSDSANDFCLFIFGESITGEIFAYKRKFEFNDGGVLLKRPTRIVVSGS